MARRPPATLILTALALGLAGCRAGAAQPTPTAGPPEAFVPIVSATGQVVPDRWATLSLPMGGVIEDLRVVEGDSVAQGELLLRLSGRAQLEAALAAARVEQLAAQQALDEILADHDLARAQAQRDLARARDELRKAEYNRSVQQEGHRASQDTIRRAKANITLAQARLDEAKDVYDSIGGSSDDPAKAQALAAYLSAKASLDAARRAYNWYTGHPTEIQQAMLDADVAVAEAMVTRAERAWQDVQGGPDPDVLAMARARLEQASAAVRAAQAALRESELRAPFRGTIAALYVRPNEWVAPGSPLLDLADLTRLHVETTDLSEIDVARVRLGAPVAITFDALPEVVAHGRVARLAPRASPGSGVNYTAWIELDQVPQGVLWGMTAFVDIEVEEEG